LAAREVLLFLVKTLIGIVGVFNQWLRLGHLSHFKRLLFESLGPIREGPAV
jgi:hypothetical protein